MCGDLEAVPGQTCVGEGYEFNRDVMCQHDVVVLNKKCKCDILTAF